MNTWSWIENWLPVHAFRISFPWRNCSIFRLDFSARRKLELYDVSSRKLPAMSLRLRVSLKTYCILHTFINSLAMRPTIYSLARTSSIRSFQYSCLVIQSVMEPLQAYHCTEITRHILMVPSIIVLWLA